MAIVVTTSTGHIGSRVAKRLLAAGADVVLLVRHPEKLPEGFRRPRLSAASEKVPPLFGIAPLRHWGSPIKLTRRVKIF